MLPELSGKVLRFLLLFSYIGATTGIYRLEFFPSVNLRNGYMDSKMSLKPSSRSGWVVNGWISSGSTFHIFNHLSMVKDVVGTPHSTVRPMNVLSIHNLMHFMMLGVHPQRNWPPLLARYSYTTWTCYITIWNYMSWSVIYLNLPWRRIEIKQPTSLMVHFLLSKF